MCDPQDLPGLAHFCEHMLFLGTEKYPVENEYPRFLSEHGKVLIVFHVYLETGDNCFPLSRWQFKCLHSIRSH